MFIRRCFTVIIISVFSLASGCIGYTSSYGGYGARPYYGGSYSIPAHRQARYPQRAMHGGHYDWSVRQGYNNQYDRHHHHHHHDRH